jgi:hypothetical protein
MKYFASQAVKQDIVRSLASRLELHWDSLIEEEHGSPEGMLPSFKDPLSSGANVTLTSQVCMTTMLWIVGNSMV